ncbi:MAG: class I SAM-dependent methyltransferase [Caldilineaceae bacterium]|nr:class I SAM-dependent methyltransferase [Caldilineaceae bacterium]
MTEETSGVPEEMAAFFDLRAEGYDQHIRGYVFTETEFNQFYAALVAPIAPTDRPIQVLDLGCGTGLELEFLFRRAPHAQVTGIDVSPGMLAVLRARYADAMPQITLVEDSYLTAPLETRDFDYVLSAMTAHHLLHDAKDTLYRRIHAALKPGGKYIEGDSVTTVAMEAEFLAEYAGELATAPPAADGHYHVDVPLSLSTQETLLRHAGFKDFTLLWQRDPADMWNAAVYAMTA